MCFDDGREGAGGYDLICDTMGWDGSGAFGRRIGLFGFMARCFISVNEK